jgi:hypothetical protein
MDGDGLVAVDSKEDLPTDVLKFFESQADLGERYFPRPSALGIHYGGRCFKMQASSFCEINMDGGALLFFSTNHWVYVLFLGAFTWSNPVNL